MSNKSGFFRQNGLSLSLLLIFLLLWLGQTYAGWIVYNNELARQHFITITFGSYLLSAHFAEATSENWESEFLQIMFYIFMTAALHQKGSAESKPIPEKDAHSGAKVEQPKRNSPWPVRQGGWILKIYEYSLSLAFLFLFLFSFVWHAYSGHRLDNEERIMEDRSIQSFWEFFLSSQFWFQSLQNWQSEFLAVLALVLLSIWLRHKGSPQSKPVSAPHSQTGA